ncbi:MAG: biopolymer transporter ExbD [Ignavibacteria bacterium]|nr:biopolymer transporter ExbD [Ignavibacteria bacterium]
MASVEQAEGGGEKRGRKKNKWQQRKRVGFHIDMTPYVDVIMLLLTFFIMTSTLNQPQVMQINLPKGDENTTVKVDMGNVVFVRISEKGNIGLSKGKSDGTEEQPIKVNLQQLKQYLEGWGTQNKDMIMILKFHRKAKYDMMISVLDEINRAAIEKRYSFSKMEEPDFKVLEAIGG